MAFGMMKCLFLTALPGRGVLDGQRISMWRAGSGPGALPACGAQRRNKCAHRRIPARSLGPPCVIALTYPSWRRGEQAWRRRISAICLLAGGAAITLLDMIRKKRCRACGAAGGGERCLKVRGAVRPIAAAEVWCLGRESNPYGLRRGIFVTLRLSPPASRSCAGLCLRRGAMRGRRPPSSLYTFSSLSLARRCLGAQARGFADFEGIHAGAFAARCSIKFKSLVSTNSTTQAAECAFYRSPLLA